MDIQFADSPARNSGGDLTGEIIEEAGGRQLVPLELEQPLQFFEVLILVFRTHIYDVCY
jgi:hypothetical protein